MKNLLSVLIIFQFLTLNLYGQIRGEVIGKDINEPLIGVTIIEKNTENGVVTDIDGKFKLKPLGKCPILEIRYTGYETKEVKILDFEKYQVIDLAIDSIDLKQQRFWGCIFYPRYSLLGLSGGLKSSTLGIRAENITPSLFRQRLFLITSIEWRKNDTENEYLELLVRRYNFLRIGGEIDFNLTMGLNRIRTEIEGIDRINRQYLLGEFAYHKTGIGIGLTRQELNEQRSKDYGLQLKIYRELLGIVYVTGGIEFMKENQYFLEVRTDISLIGLNVGLRYRQIKAFEDYEVFVGYRFDY